MPCVALLSSCGPDMGKQLSDYKDATTADSMLYYYSRMQAYEYFKLAQNDTTLLHLDQREKYLEGVKDGIAAVRKGADNENYNLGLRRGARMMLRMLEIEETYGVHPDYEIMVESFTKGIMDTAAHINQQLCQNKFFMLFDRMRAQEHEAQMERAAKSLIEEARRNNLAKIGPNLYYRIETKGKGEYAEYGDALQLSVKFRRSGGHPLVLPTTERMVVGAVGIPEVLNQAYTRLNKGSTGIFATTAESVFGSRSEIMGLNADDVLIITITLNEIDKPDGNPGHIET